MSTAFLLGGTGQIGRATAKLLTERGWDVTLAARREADLQCPFVRVDRTADGELERALPPVDVLVDVVAFTQADAAQLLALRDRIGSAIVISSASVYCDADGRTLDEAAGDEELLPQLPVPIPETNPTVAPGDETYSTRKVAVEQLLLDSELPTTIVRPCAIHGPGARLPREWHFVKRVLDGRRKVVLAHRGESLFHTTSPENLAELIRLAADSPGARIVNCGDPKPPTVLEIERACAAALDHEWAEVLLDGRRADGVGDNPWGLPPSKPLVISMEYAERELGYRPPTTYGESVRATCSQLADDRGASIDPERIHYLGPFDYDAEDALEAA